MSTASGKATATKSGDPKIESEAHLAVLRHLGRHRMSFRQLLEREFFGGRAKPCDNALESLKQKGLVQVLPRALGRYSAYQLTSAGAQAAAVPISRARKLGPAALLRHLAILWFCFCCGKTRIRTEKAELAHPSLFGTEVDGDYCLQSAGKEFSGGKVLPLLYQVQILLPGGRVDHLVDRLENFLPILEQSPSLSLFLQLKLCGFAVLGFQEDELAEARKRIRKSGLDKRLRVDYELVPSPHTFETFKDRFPKNDD